MVGRIFADSPVGLLLITSENGFLTGVQPAEKVVGDIRRDDAASEAERQLDEYFSGVRKSFDLPIKLYGTDFQRAVLEELTKIPFGETRSYGDIAVAVGNPKAYRAVGNAVGRNPLLIIVPCHRVISGNGGIGGFSADMNIKKYLLNFEQETEQVTHCSWSG